ncbi:glycosyltransferase family 2 protein [Cohnella sp. JJ-181]|uniref:glycosyltransferase family 2 protein n=1 Tax=Cohnella rhizoplanae TaxID=2974897 RepID=UPI0022FF9CA0|nr:glycosyltransferase family 2 protein [Cohnella sp. JJ-181]CAI6087587.1 hypothetical protein COHCIP112018_05601 [Cohnella sp. JJ-181]
MNNTLYNSPSSKIDILMATYNGADFLREQIESVLNQSYSHFSLLISDDCSTDNTREILNEYSRRDPRITLFFQSRNLGVIKNFEFLLSRCQSKYFMLCDQDDIWLERKIEKSLEKIQNVKGILVYSDLKLVDKNANEIHPSFWGFMGLIPVSGSPWKTLLVQNIITGCTILASSEIIKDILPFPSEAKMHDSWIALIASLRGGVHFINEPLVNYRQHERNLVGARARNIAIYQSKTYRGFLEERKHLLLEKANYLNRFSEYLLNYKDFDEVKQFEQIHIKVSASSIKHINTVIKIKLKFPSQGAMRNLWWLILMGLPWFCYLLIKLKRYLFEISIRREK